MPATAEVSVSGNTLTFDGADGSFAYTLNVSGPNDFRHVEHFEAGSLMSWSAVGVGDGLYKYELVPMAAARERGADAEDFQVDAERISGALRLRNGAFPNPDQQEMIEKAQTIATDLIVQGSACVGFDCTTSESFGFDTLRLKENNLRIKFQDTSNSGSFPSNDWQLSANDTGNGGSNHFSIDDIDGGKTPFRVEAGARTNALVVESDGDIGIGTLDPVTEIHVVRGDSPTLRLEQDGSSGFTPQTFDLVSNEANFFIRDVTNGSQLPFRIKPGADTDALYIDSNNEIGIGTNNPGARLHIRQGGAAFSAFAGTSFLLQNTAATSDNTIMTLLSGSSGQSQINFGETGNEFLGRIRYEANNGRMRIDTNGNTNMTIEGDGDVCLGDGAITCDHDLEINPSGGSCSEIDAGETAFTVCSSRTFKENMQEIQVPNILEKIAGIDVYNYDFIDGGGRNKLGLMAEDFHQVFERGSETMLSGQEVQMALWLAVKELTAQNQQLTERLQALESAK